MYVMMSLLLPTFTEALIRGSQTRTHHSRRSTVEGVDPVIPVQEENRNTCSTKSLRFHVCSPTSWEWVCSAARPAASAAVVAAVASTCPIPRGTRCVYLQADPSEISGGASLLTGILSNCTPERPAARRETSEGTLAEGMHTLTAGEFVLARGASMVSCTLIRVLFAAAASGRVSRKLGHACIPAGLQIKHNGNFGEPTSGRRLDTRRDVRFAEDDLTLILPRVERVHR